MKKTLALLPIAALLLAGCGGTTQAAAQSAPATTVAPSAAVQTLQAAIATSSQSDSIYLAAIRKTITTGSDADLTAAGHKVCAYKASGLTGGDLSTKVQALGYTPAQALSLIITASMTYCKA